jgi:hypothetical protein
MAARDAQRVILGAYTAFPAPSGRKPSPAIVKLKSKAADETRCRQELVAMMGENPDQPTPKAELKALFPGVTQRQFNSAFTAAVKEAQAWAWSAPGRRRKSNHLTK